MVTISMMQFTAMVLLLLLTMKLLLLHGRRSAGKIATRSRWLLATGTLILALHFALQLALGLRLMGVTQAVMLNLAMFIPASTLLSWAVLLLQRRGKLSRLDWLAGPTVWVLAMALLGVAAAVDGQPLLSDTPELHRAEVTGCVLYMLMLCYYTARLIANLIAMRRALRYYYDNDTYGILVWMQQSIIVLTLLELMTPLAILSSGMLLLFVAFAVFFAIFYLADSFCSYLNSNAPARVMAAEVNADEVEQEREADSPLLSDEAMKDIDEAVAAWTDGGGHLKAGLLLPIAAVSIGVPKYRLTCWLHQKGLKYSDWVAELRVKEAQRLIKAHPDWSNEAVANHCGFTERSLHRTFKKLTGMTPAQFAEREKAYSSRSGDGSVICCYSLNNPVTDARYSGQLSESCSLVAYLFYDFVSLILL